MITVDIKHKAFHEVAVLGPISFEVQSSETLAILGASGIGKSTLLRLIAGLDKKFDGKIALGGKLSVVFQEPILIPWLSTYDNLSVIARDQDRSSIQAMLGKVGLTGKDQLFPGQLSLGQQRRLSLARAFLVEPEILLLDEPFASLDAKTAKTMVKLTRELMSDSRLATIIVTHSEKEATELAQKSIYLEGSPATIKRE